MSLQTDECTAQCEVNVIDNLAENQTNACSEASNYDVL